MKPRSSLENKWRRIAFYRGDMINGIEFTAEMNSKS